MQSEGWFIENDEELAAVAEMEDTSDRAAAMSKAWQAWIGVF